MLRICYSGFYGCIFLFLILLSGPIGRPLTAAKGDKGDNKEKNREKTKEREKQEREIAKELAKNTLPPPPPGPVIIPTAPEWRKSKTRPNSVAFCLTGQLARLELLSKVQNIFIPNTARGYIVHAFVLLDNQVEEVKQTFWKFDYSDSLFGNYDSEKMLAYLNKKAELAGVSDKFVSRVRLEEPGQLVYQIVGGHIPVDDKVVNQHKLGGAEKLGSGENKEGFEPAAVRFQNNMRWLGGLRDCVRWVQDTEYEQGWFYDFVVRLRDDTLAFDEWIITPEKYQLALTSARTGGFRGINDHNFVIDRKWADTLFRGFTEDYYFNKSLIHESWGNPEHRIYQVATANNIPIRNTTICEQPLMPLRGKYNNTHWLVHPSYTKKFKIECEDVNTKKKDKCFCKDSWYRMFENGFVRFDMKE